MYIFIVHTATSWPSGLRRYVQVVVLVGVGSNPTDVTFAQSMLSRFFLGDWLFLGHKPKPSHGSLLYFWYKSQYAILHWQKIEAQYKNHITYLVVNVPKRNTACLLTQCACLPIQTRGRKDQGPLTTTNLVCLDPLHPSVWYSRSLLMVLWPICICFTGLCYTSQSFSNVLLERLGLVMYLLAQYF